MSVYIDKASNCRGNMIMSHMMADSDAELDAFAARLGLQPSWRHNDHYDVSRSKRAMAIKLGVVEVPTCELVAMRKSRREGRAAADKGRTRMLEKDMLPAVLAWLRTRCPGGDVVPELYMRGPCCGGRCDAAAIEFYPRTGRRIPLIKEFHAVEMKLNRHSEALRQALSYTLDGGFVWVAMPDATVIKMKQEHVERLQMAGIGLLAVNIDSDLVSVICHSIKHVTKSTDAHKVRWRSLAWKGRSGQVATEGNEEKTKTLVP